MKRVGFYGLIFLAVIIANSCENEPFEDGIYTSESNDPTEIPVDFQNTFSAQLDGQPFIIQHLYTTIGDRLNENDIIAITATKTDYHSIIIYLPSTIIAGTYHYSPESTMTVPDLNVTYSNLENVLESGVGDGILVIEEHSLLNQHIKGTFECVVNSATGAVHHITDGSFDVVY